MKHEIGLDGGNTWDIQESSEKSYDQLPPSQAFPNCEAGPEEEVVLELPMGAGSDGVIMGDPKTQHPVKWIAAVCSATCYI